MILSILLPLAWYMRGRQQRFQVAVFLVIVYSKVQNSFSTVYIAACDGSVPLLRDFKTCFGENNNNQHPRLNIKNSLYKRVHSARVCIFLKVVLFIFFQKYNTCIAATLQQANMLAFWCLMLNCTLYLGLWILLYRIIFRLQSYIFLLMK